jgi:TonB family protein
MKRILMSTFLFFALVFQFQAQELNKNQYQLLEQKVQKYKSQKDWENASKSMDQMYKGRKNHEAKFYYKYGLILYKANRMDEAEIQFKNYIQIANPCEFCNKSKLYLDTISQKATFEANEIRENSSNIEVVEEKVEEEENGDTIFGTYAIEEQPIFPGGDTALMNYVARNTKYPAESIKNGEEGRIYVRFIINKNGEIERPVVLRGVSPLLDEEALRVVKSLPKWIPGKHKGKPVDVWFIIPVKFKL